MKTKRAHAFSEQVAANFNNIAINCFHSDDNPMLQEIRFSIKGKNFQANFGTQDIEKENQRNEAFTKVIDQGPIARDSYRNLAALQPELPRENAIYKTKKKINEEMNHAIPVSILNISEPSSLETINENLDTNDPEVVEELLKYIGKAGYRRITDILLFIIPDLVNKHILNPDNLIINLRISGDGRNVGRKMKHVMITCAILDDISNIYKADFHYTTILYPGVENYKILRKAMEPMINELHNLVTNGLIDTNGMKWRIVPYFSSDWKFLAIILGFNSANANHFCPWCLCMKKDIGNKERVYKIEKNMDQLQTSNPPPGHHKFPLLPMIPLNNYVPDELHIMLRIWDRMWALIIQELKSKNQFNDHTRAKIIAEMRRISVQFHFWQDQGTQNWVYTSLMGINLLFVRKMGMYIINIPHVVYTYYSAPIIHELLTFAQGIYIIYVPIFLMLSY
jgi:hypothetical protein